MLQRLDQPNLTTVDVVNKVSLMDSPSKTAQAGSVEGCRPWNETEQESLHPVGTLTKVLLVKVQTGYKDWTLVCHSWCDRVHPPSNPTTSQFIDGVYHWVELCWQRQTVQLAEPDTCGHTGKCSILMEVSLKCSLHVKPRFKHAHESV